ncbi:carbohydrate esterase family 1 protein [Poronia punctata]|nr:carbohydrate esterase family 1 protein [Poronia punctata]
MHTSNLITSAVAVVGLVAPPVLAAPTTAGTRATTAAGCGKERILKGITTYHDLTSSGRERNYSVHIPGDYDETKAYPVVLGFHGSDSIGFFFEADTKLSESRFSANKIMVYPDGVGGAWAGASYSEVSVDEDLQFVTDLLAELRDEYCVDDARIYATGMSIGGGFVNTIACSEVGDEFAAFAPSSGSFYTDNDGVDGGCSPARSPLPLLEVHGGNDGSVHYDGGEGEGGVEPAISDWLGWWAERNGCTSSKVEDSFDGDVHHTIWTCADDVEGVLQHWKVDDMGHCWADTEVNFSQLSVPELPTHIQASQIIIDFFDQFSKP